MNSLDRHDDFSTDRPFSRIAISGFAVKRSLSAMMIGKSVLSIDTRFLRSRVVWNAAFVRVCQFVGVKCLLMVSFLIQNSIDRSLNRRTTRNCCIFLPISVTMQAVLFSDHWHLLIARRRRRVAVTRSPRDLFSRNPFRRYRWLPSHCGWQQ